MPAATKHDAVLARIPLARQSLTVLRDAGRSDIADAVDHVLTYAKEQAGRGIAKTAADSGDTHSLRVPEAFRTHVHDQALREEGETATKVVVDSLRDFINGDWTPPAPVRAARGTARPKVGLNVRVPGDIWDAANQLGKDPAAVAARGYKLTAESVSVAALYERFGEPDTVTA